MCVKKRFQDCVSYKTERTYNDIIRGWSATLYSESAIYFKYMRRMFIPAV